MLSFEDFDLLIRGLHSYGVESFTPDPENNTLCVKLTYNCSMENVKAKMNLLQQHVSVHKMSSYVKPTELSRLEKLQRQFCIGGTSASSAGPAKKGKAVRKTPYNNPKKQAEPADLHSWDSEEA